MEEIFDIISNIDGGLSVKDKIVRIQELIEDGKHIDSFVDERGFTPLMEAISVGERLELIEFLIGIGSDVNFWDEEGTTVIALALSSVILCGECGDTDAVSVVPWS